MGVKLVGLSLANDLFILALTVVAWVIWPNVWNAIGIGIIIGSILTRHVEPRLKAKMERVEDEHRVSQDQHAV